MTTTPYIFPMIVLNLISIITLFVVVIFLFQNYKLLQNKVISIEETQTTTTQVLKNLAYDINYNDNTISDFVNARH